MSVRSGGWHPDVRDEGVLPEGDAVGATEYTYEAMKARVDEATKLG